MYDGCCTLISKVLGLAAWLVSLAIHLPLFPFPFPLTCKSSRCLDHNRLRVLLTISRGRWTALLWSGVLLPTLLPSEAFGLFPFPPVMRHVVQSKESAVVKNKHQRSACPFGKIKGEIKKKIYLYINGENYNLNALSFVLRLSAECNCRPFR